MLIGNSLPELIFIRVAVPALRLIAPAAVIAIPFVLIIRPRLLEQHKWLWPVGIWALSEATFFLGVYLPLRRVLQRSAKHPEPPSQPERRALIQKCFANLPDPEYYVSRWFMDAPPQDIKRGNVKEFLAWSLMNKQYSEANDDDEAELDEYTDELERVLDRPFQAGRGKAKSLRTTLDPVPMQHRPLIWYAVSIA
jgi:hypothetical protein